MVADLELCYLSAVEATRRFRDRSLSPVELVTALIARIEEMEPKVNALTYTFFDRAMDQARASEARFAGHGRVRRLEGLPIVIKDFHDIKGEITTYGSRLFANHRPEKSLAFVDRLLRSGVILLGRSTTPEFALLGVTHSDLWGVTRNPWNLDMSPGGSSGGAGAALAAGMTTLADGSDIAGSIRIPATFCGVFGIKPSFGRVPAGGALALDSFLAYGPLTRTVADSALMLNVMAGPHRDDPSAIPQRLRLPLEPADIEGWKIALCMDLGYFMIDPEIAAKTREAADAFREAGATVEEVTLDWHEVFEAATAHFYVYFGYDQPDLMSAEEQALLSKPAREFPDYTRRLPRMGFADAEKYRAKMYQDMSAIFARYRLLISPSAALPAVAADLPVEGPPLRIDHQPIDPVWGWYLSYPFNMLGHLPSASVPCGQTSSGVPNGVQVVGRPYDEASVLRASAALERVRPAGRPAIA